MTNINIKVDDELYKVFKSKCALKGKQVKETIIEHIKKEV